MAWMGAVAAAAQKQQDERLLAQFLQQDVERQYEFKVLRGGLASFRNPERFRTVLEQEAQAQWELVVKLDDARIVLRRPRDARSRDALRDTGIAPYRTELSSARIAALVAILLGLVFTAAIFAFVFVERRGTATLDDITWPVVGVTVGVLLVTLLVAVKLAVLRRR
jgi:hypothetical protein